MYNFVYAMLYGSPRGKGYGKIHALLHTSDRAWCKHAYAVLTGEFKNEPDVHICLDHIPEHNCVVYSIGIANNWIFDDFMLRQGCSVYSFDPSMEGVKKHKRHPNHLFEPIGIGTTTGIYSGKSTLYGGKKKYPVETLDHIMKRHGHKNLTILRIDTEGAEWSVFEQWLENGWFDRIDQLLVEIHMFDSSQQVRYSDILTAIPMKLFHTARNRFDNMPVHGLMTKVYELGWLR